MQYIDSIQYSPSEDDISVMIACLYTASWKGKQFILKVKSVAPCSYARLLLGGNSSTFLPNRFMARRYFLYKLISIIFLWSIEEVNLRFSIRFNYYRPFVNQCVSAIEKNVPISIKVKIEFTSRSLIHLIVLCMFECELWKINVLSIFRDYVLT